MPDSPDFDFDAARRSLDAVPAPDLWDDAQRRAAGGGVVPLAVGGEHRRRSGRWLAVAAAAVLTVGAVAVLLDDDGDRRVDSGPAGAVDDGISRFQSGDCTFGVTHPPGETVPRATDGDQQPRLDDQPSTRFGVGTTQNALVHVPGYSVRDLVGERVEDVELARGTAQLWLTPQFVQVRWFPSIAQDDPCESFTVTVGATFVPTGEDGTVATATEDENRRAAVDFAERIVLQSELPPQDSAPTAEGPTVASGGGACFFGVSGDPIVLLPGPADPPLFDPGSRAPETTVVHASLGTQTAELQVPGLVVNDLVGEQVEQVELGRGTADVWFGTDFVQVRWFTGSQADCDSFTVTVTGGTEDGNRHAAVDLAERLLLPSELYGGPAPVTDVVAGDWQLERSTVDDVPTDGDGLTFGFVDGQARWTDGCNDFTGTYEGIGATTMHLIDIMGTKVACPPNPTAEAVQAVMSAEQIEVTAGSGRDIVVLSAGTTVLTLVPIDPQTTTSIGEQSPGTSPGAATGAGYGIWPMTGPESQLGYRPEFVGSALDTAAAFARSVLGWEDAEAVGIEPPHDGYGVLSVGVTSPSRGRSVGMLVAEAQPATNGHVVYAVSGEGTTAKVTVRGNVGRVDLEGEPEGTVSSELSFTYGEQVYPGDLGADVDFFSGMENWDKTPLAGAALVLFRDADGVVIGAWGSYLPTGDLELG